MAERKEVPEVRPAVGSWGLGRALVSQGGVWSQGSEHVSWGAGCGAGEDGQQSVGRVQARMAVPS